MTPNLKARLLAIEAARRADVCFWQSILMKDVITEPRP
jgi:hypothetical protein